MAGLSLLAAVQADSLLAVLEEDSEWELRSILRWYSRTFHTPLHVVEDLPPEDVFQAWFETRYEQMDRSELIDQARLVIETPEQRAERLKLEQEAEDEDLAFLESALKSDAKKEKERLNAKGKKLVTTKLPAPKAPPRVATLVPDDDLPPIKVEFRDSPVELDEGAEPL